MADNDQAMSLNTIEENKRRNPLQQGQSHWLFGYGSLIFKVDFPYIESKPACIHGWSRRFWQGSHDHRGTIEYPGRVVTLIEEADAVCHGLAFRVDSSVFEQLDVREKNGYLRLFVDLEFDDSKRAPGLIYIATSDNEAFLGEASEKQIAEQIAYAKGPSGSNSDYLFGLAESLRDLGLQDDHVFGIEKHLKQLCLKI